MFVEIISLLKNWHFNDVLAELTAVVIYLAIITIACWLVNFILKKYIVRLARKLARRSGTKWGSILAEHDAFKRLSHLGPGLVIYEAIPLLESQHYPWVKTLSQFIQTLAVIYMLFAVVWFLMSLIKAFETYYNGLKYALQHPIRGYLQILRIIIWFVSVVFAISILLNKSPWAFFTGLGAISAVLMLVFKDTILGFVASIQVSAYDMVRVGDWITLPKLGANGDVIEVSINTVKIRNFDHTIVTIPTYSLINNGVQNWRGMSESGGRRIKRSIYIDLDTIHFCQSDELEQFKQLTLLKTHIEDKQQEISRHNQSLGLSEQKLQINGRSLTNIGLFRAYIEKYLHQNKHIHQQFTFLVRQLQPTETGLPLQLYIFTNDVNWANYETIQADIFDHLLSALPIFNLRAFQSISSQTKLPS